MTAARSPKAAEARAAEARASELSLRGISGFRQNLRLGFGGFRLRALQWFTEQGIVLVPPRMSLKSVHPNPQAKAAKSSKCFRNLKAELCHGRAPGQGLC